MTRLEHSPPDKAVYRPRLLDLFCGAGGAAMGYQRAGFYVIGVDVEPQPNYCGDEFHRADAFDVLASLRDRCRWWWKIGDQDAIHASPPCQSYTTMSNRYGSKSPRLIGAVRELLEATGLPYVIENVYGAKRELRSPVRMCGRSLGLPIHRHRLFETSWPLMIPPCSGDKADPYGVYGHKHDGRRLWTRRDGSVYRAARTIEEAREAMGMPWADWRGCAEAIPPLYTELIGHQLMQQIQVPA